MRIIVCDRCGADISREGSAVGGFTTPRKLGIILIPQGDETLLSTPSTKSVVDLCKDCDNWIYNEIFGSLNAKDGDNSV